jgi:ferredoxin
VRPLAVRIDREACTGARACTLRAPHTFRLDAERKAVASDPPADPDELVLAAARSCPNFAIELSRDGQAVG